MNRTTHTPINLALECAALQALRQGWYDWPGSAAAQVWDKLAQGLSAAGAVEAVKTHDWRIVWETLPDDPLYYGLCGDGQGDLFAVARESIVPHLTVKFPSLAPLE